MEINSIVVGSCQNRKISIFLNLIPTPMPTVEISEFNLPLFQDPKISKPDKFLPRNIGLTLVLYAQRHTRKY